MNPFWGITTVIQNGFLLRYRRPVPPLAVAAPAVATAGLTAVRARAAGGDGRYAGCLSTEAR